MSSVRLLLSRRLLVVGFGESKIYVDFTGQGFYWSGVDYISVNFFFLKVPRISQGGRDIPFYLYSWTL